MGHKTFAQHVLAVRRPEGCWIWDGTKDWKGYGRYAGRPAHQRSYEIFVGEIPEGQIIRHACDVRDCINPAHLTPGTQADNSNDMKARGRQARGERHSQVKLTEAAVRDVRRMLTYGFKQRFIAASVGVDRSTVSNIKSGKSWGWF